MTAAAALAAAHGAGLTVLAEGDRLRWHGPPPPADVLAGLRAHKAALLALLAAGNDNPLPPDPPPPSPAATVHLAPADAPQAAAERRDRAAIAADPGPAATVPVPAAQLAQWEAELAGLLAATPGQRIVDPARAAVYFAAEARRRLGLVRHDHDAAGLVMQHWRHARRAAP